MNTGFDPSKWEELAGLISETQVMSKGYASGGAVMGQAWVGLDSDRLKQWLDKAFNIAKSVKADSVSITSGFPIGISITVNFDLKKPLTGGNLSTSVS